MSPPPPPSLKRIAILTNHPVSVPLIQTARDHEVSVEVATLDEDALLAGAMELAGFSLDICRLSSTTSSWLVNLHTWLDRIQADALWVMSFPRRLPRSILDRLPAGCWNFHLGPLPQYRGADPIFWLIRNGEAQGALTVHHMAPEMDCGNIFRCYPVGIDGHTTYGSHLRDLGEAARQAGLDLIRTWTPAGYPALQPQDPASATLWPRPELRQQLIEWNHMTATQADAMARACNPIYGGAKCRIMDHTVQVFATSVAAAVANKQPGRIMHVSDDAITVACAHNTCLKVHSLGTAEGIYHAPQWVSLPE